MPVATATTSAAGSLALLQDDDKHVRVYALQHLLTIVAQFWAEISDQIGYIETLSEPLNNELPSDSAPYAALLVSKVYYYIGELDEAVSFALKAGKAFEEEPSTEYKETIIYRAIALTSGDVSAKLDSGLLSIVNSVLKNTSGENGKLAIGLALSLRRLDLIENIYLSSNPSSAASSSSSVTSPHDESLLRYILNEVIGGAGGNDWTPEFRNQLFELLLTLFQSNPNPDWHSITTLWIQANDQNGCAEQLIQLLNSENLAELYQIGFDLAEMGGQGFVHGVRTKFAAAGLGPSEELESTDPRRIFDQILLGEKSAELFLNFLSKSNKTDLSQLKVTKDSLEDRYSIYHSAITFTNAYANCGTTSDKFLRENLDWLGRASNWAKFSATAALGLIHKGSWVNGIKVVKPYLPGGAAPSKFSEGGALFALGLIYSGRKEKAEEELRKGLQEGNDPIVQHGAALGLGVSALATADEDIYEDIRTALFQDNATAGEAAGYAMGLVMLGTASEKAFDEMVSYARETQHEKIIRSLAVGIAFLFYGKRDAADGVIDRLSQEKDSIMRYGAMFTIALAYAGTGNNKAVRRLLHVAVSDVNDDVRRAAVTALGFVMFRNHTQVPRVVQLLAESYNPHVRHGATLALGISCAGTGLEAAVDLLEPMTKDPVDFVRQGAYISLAMILIQQNEAQSPKVTAIRELFAKVVADKHEDPMARFGASLASGIIDAGGKNMTLSLSTRAGTLNMGAIVGMTLFVQFWYWFPLAHGLGLALTPTCLIAVDEQLRVPKVDFKCHGKQSVFGYPVKAKGKKEEVKGKQKAAVLSTTARSKARERKKKEEDGEMDVDNDATGPSGSAKDASASAASPSAAIGTAAKKDRKPAEPSEFAVPNMSRVTPHQAPLLSFPSDGRYKPMRRIGDTDPSSDPRLNGTINGTDKPASVGRSGTGAAGEKRLAGGSIVILRDSTPDKEGEFVELDKALWPETVPGQGEAVADDAAAAGATGSAGIGGAAAGALTGLGIGGAALSAVSGEEEFEEAGVPESFEYPFDEE